MSDIPEGLYTILKPEFQIRVFVDGSSYLSVQGLISLNGAQYHMESQFPVIETILIAEAQPEALHRGEAAQPSKENQP